MDEEDLISPHCSFSNILLHGRFADRSFSLDHESQQNLASTPFSSVYAVKVVQVEEDLENLGGLRTWVAVKASLRNSNKAPHFPRKEANILAGLDHPSIVPLLNSYMTSDSIYIQMPCYPTTLSNLLNLSSFKPSADLTSPSNTQFKVTVKSFLYQIVSALSYLHSDAVSVSHRDIKPSNFVISLDGRVVLIDFDTAWKDYEGQDERPGQFHFELGTMPYRPPELLFGSQDYDPKALDLWCLGATIAEFFTPLVPEGSNFMEDGRDDERIQGEPVRPPWMRRSSDSEEEEEDDDDSLSDLARDLDLNPDSRAYVPSDEHLTLSTKSHMRAPLFDGKHGEIGLLGSIFKVLGTPTPEDWPESSTLPDYKKIQFKSMPRQDLSALLPNLPQDRPFRDQVMDLISKLLISSASKRIQAKDALRPPLFSGDSEPPVVLPPRYPPVEMEGGNANVVKEWEGHDLSWWTGEWLMGAARIPSE